MPRRRAASPVAARFFGRLERREQAAGERFSGGLVFRLAARSGHTDHTATARARPIAALAPSGA
ncbi:MAG TPA: hypothetical protein VKB13_07830 [Gaiellaceae bacterium]|nr:hypothetical protein [Gaiellaceae bacterium]